MVRQAARRSEMQVMFAVRMRLGRSRSGPAWTCIEDLRVRTSLLASCRAQRTACPRSYRVRHRRLELWTPPQERRGLCQAPDTRMSGSTLEKSKTRLRLFSPASTPLERQSV
jgi:hypothetical protein